MDFIRFCVNVKHIVTYQCAYMSGVLAELTTCSGLNSCCKRIFGGRVAGLLSVSFRRVVPFNVSLTSIPLVQPVMCVVSIVTATGWTTGVRFVAGPWTFSPRHPHSLPFSGHKGLFPQA